MNENMSEIDLQVANNIPEHKAQYKVIGSSRTRFLIESAIASALIFIALTLLFSESHINMNHISIYTFTRALGTGSIFSYTGGLLLLSVWIWNFLIWYNRLLNMGFGLLTLIALTAVSYATFGVLGILFWFWLAIDKPKKQLTYVKNETL